MLTIDEFRAICSTTLGKIRIQTTNLTSENDNTPFSVMGLDSLDMMSFLLELEIVLDAQLEEMDMKEYNTVFKIYSFYEALEK